MAFALQPTKEEGIINIVRIDSVSENSSHMKGHFDSTPMHVMFQIRYLQNGTPTLDFETASHDVMCLMNGVTPAKKTTSMEFRFASKEAQIILRARNPEAGITRDILSVTKMGTVDLPQNFGQHLAATYDISSKDVDRKITPTPT